MTLDELALKYNTDKSSADHQYTQFYQKHIGHLNPQKMLEFGIYSTGLPSEYAKAGASLKMWYEYFTTAEIIGIDLHDYSCLNNDRIFTQAANCELRHIDDYDTSVLNPWLQHLYNQFPGGRIGMNEIVDKYGVDYDIIIDDAPHTQRSNQTVLGFMFPYLKSGGIFIIEDLHTSYSPSKDVYNSFPETSKTTLWMLQHYIETKQIESDFMTSDEIDYLEEHIDHIVIERGKNSEIAFIVKK
jgi:hypothetical protein